MPRAEACCSHLKNVNIHVYKAVARTDASLLCCCWSCGEMPHDAGSSSNESGASMHQNRLAVGARGWYVTWDWEQMVTYDLRIDALPTSTFTKQWPGRTPACFVAVGLAVR